MGACPVCGFKENSLYLAFQGRDYSKCGQCRLVFSGGQDASSQTQEMYTHEYLHKRGHDSDDSNVTRAKEVTARRYLSRLEKYTAKGALLDMGCSTGSALKAARDRGWDIYGIDVNGSAAEIAKKNLNTENIQTGELTDEMFPDGFFSAVLMLDVIEHVANPLKLMDLVQRKLKSSGLLLIITPNIESVSARILRGKWPHQLLEHVCLYAPGSIEHLLKRSRLKIVKMGWAIKYINLDILKRHLELHPHIFLSKAVGSVIAGLGAFKTAVFPLNVGEMFILAQKP